MRRLLRLIDEVPLGWVVAAPLALILVFAVGYWALDAAGMAGLAATYDTSRPLGFADALYFSVVTLSSLGYGDIRPTGVARLLAGAEVVFGLALFGFIVAKISSVKQDYLLKRLYSELVDEKLAKYVATLEESGKLYRITSNLLLSGDIDPELTYTFRADVPEATFFYQTHTLLHEIRDLMVFESHHGGFFGDVSDAHVSQIFASVKAMMQHTLTIFERDRQRACDYVLCGNGPWIAEMLDLAEEMARLGKRGSRDTDIVEQCAGVLELSARMRAEVLPNI